MFSYSDRKLLESMYGVEEQAIQALYEECVETDQGWHTELVMLGTIGNIVRVEGDSPFCGEDAVVRALQALCDGESLSEGRGKATFICKATAD